MADANDSKGNSNSNSKSKGVAKDAPIRYYCEMNGCGRQLTVHKGEYDPVSPALIDRYCKKHREEYNTRTCPGCWEVAFNDRDCYPAPYCSKECSYVHTTRVSRRTGQAYDPEPVFNMYCVWCTKGLCADAPFTVQHDGQVYPICSTVCGQEQFAAPNITKIHRIQLALYAAHNTRVENQSKADIWEQIQQDDQ